MTTTIEQLQAFLTVAETGNFTRAADRLGMSQSSLSTMVGKLEAQLSSRLFERHTRGCRVSDAGAGLLPSARRMVQEWVHMTSSARDMAALGSGRLSIAAPSAQSALLLPPLMRALTDRLPGLRITLHDVGEQQVHALVRDAVADVGITTQTEARTELVATPFYSDLYIAVMRPDHPLARRKSLEWTHLRDEPVVGPLADNPVRRHLDARLTQEGLELAYRHEVSMPWTMVGLVRERFGIAVLTTAMLPMIEWHQLVVRPITRPTVARTLVLLRLPGRALSAPAVVFRDLLTGGSKLPRRVTPNR